MNSDEKIKVVMILDIVGRPSKHLVETLEKLIRDIGKEKGVEVISKNIKEPVLMKNQENFYTTFAEVEVDVEEISQLYQLMFKYMPANVEIISPEMLVLSNDRINEILNDLVIKLHGYDELARVMQLEKQILFNKIHELGGEIPSQVRPPARIHQPGEEKQMKNMKTVVPISQQSKTKKAGKKEVKKVGVKKKKPSKKKSKVKKKSKK